MPVIVKRDSTVDTETVWAENTASPSYFAANMVEIVAIGAAAQRMLAVRAFPLTPSATSAASDKSGRTISRRRYSSHSSARLKTLFHWHLRDIVADNEHGNGGVQKRKIFHRLIDDLRQTDGRKKQHKPADHRQDRRMQKDSLQVYLSLSRVHHQHPHRPDEDIKNRQIRCAVKHALLAENGVQKRDRHESAVGKHRPEAQHLCPFTVPFLSPSSSENEQGKQDGNAVDPQSRARRR